MSKAADLARTASASETALSNRNVVINGAMQISQRSVSETGLGAASGYFTLDRWNISTSSSAGRLTMTQTADGPSGFANCLKLDCTTADTSIAAAEFLLLQQRFEGQDLQQLKKGTSDAELITVSFYVKANAAFDFVLELQDSDNSRNIHKVFATTTGWVRHELTFPADTTGAFDDDNASSLQLNFWLHAGATFAGGTLNTAWADKVNANRAAGIDSFYSSTDNNFFITGVQMEVGTVATPFEHRSYGQELALCQRYFQKVGGEADGNSVSVGAGLWYTTTIVLGHLQFQKRMRAAPTVANTETDVFKINYSTAAVDSNDATPISVLQPTSARISSTMQSGGTAGHGAYVITKGANRVTFDAEL